MARKTALLLLAAVVGAAVGEYGLGGGFWTVLIAALVGGFAPIVGYRVWVWRVRRRGRRAPAGGGGAAGGCSL